MDSDEYHARRDDDDTQLTTCPFCGLNWHDHTRTCPYGEPDDYDDPVARGKAEDNYLADFLKEPWTEGP